MLLALHRQPSLTCELHVRPGLRVVTCVGALAFLLFTSTHVLFRLFPCLLVDTCFFSKYDAYNSWLKSNFKFDQLYRKIYQHTAATTTFVFTYFQKAHLVDTKSMRIDLRLLFFGAKWCQLSPTSRVWQQRRTLWVSTQWHGASECLSMFAYWKV
jgi:hypothetical protein